MVLQFGPMPSLLGYRLHSGIGLLSSDVFNYGILLDRADWALEEV